MIEFLDTLEMTLNQIEVKGKNNIDYMLGCFVAIEKMKKALIAQQKSNETPVNEETIEEEN